MWDGAPIFTAQGPAPIETLKPGSEVLAVSGQPIRVVSVARRPQMDDPAPDESIHIVAKAFGNGHPECDVELFPNTPVLFDDTIVAAKTLVNAATVIRRLRSDSAPPWQVMLESLNPDDTTVQAYVPLFNGEGYVHADMDLPTRLEKTPAPSSIRRRLMGVAAEFGHVLTVEPDLHVLVDGVAIAPRRVNLIRFVFKLPPGGSSIRLMSRVWVPAEIRPDSDDHRLLGVCVRRLVLDGHEIDLGGLGEGWDKLEEHGKLHVRWTKGQGVIPVASPRTLDVELYGFGSYWVETKAP